MMMEPGVGLALFIAFSAVLLVVFVLVDVYVLSYRRLGSDRQWIAHNVVSHYVAERHLLTDGAGGVTIAPQTKRHVLGPGPAIRKRTLAYVYVGRNGRGGILNHGPQRAETRVRIDVDGADFLSWLGDKDAYYRRWDGALGVAAAYSGPGSVSGSLSPREDRRRTADPSSL